MKNCLIIILLTLATYSNSKTITKDEIVNTYNEIIKNINKKEWTISNELTRELLTTFNEIGSFNKEEKILKYIYIYTTAGMINEKKITNEEAIKKLECLKGHKMELPALPFKKRGTANYIKKDKCDSTFVSIIKSSEKSRVSTYEYVHIKRGIKEKTKELEGDLIVLEGVLREIIIEGKKYPKLKLKFGDGEYKILDR
jgi:hypothetical protein